MSKRNISADFVCDGYCHCVICQYSEPGLEKKIPDGTVGYKCRGCSLPNLAVSCYNASRKCYVCVSPLVDKQFMDTTTEDRKSY
jgi:hypothetical protein